MAIGKFPSQRTAFFEAFFEGDYRTHTVPVKKYEPKMFMGKEVPYGATHYILEGDNVVFFMMHSGLGMCVHFDHEGGSSWINYNNTKYPAHTFYELIKLPKQENIMKEFTKADLRSGHKVKCRNGEIFTVFLNASSDGSDVLSGDHSWTNLTDMNNDLTAKFSSEVDIMEVYSNPVYCLSSDKLFNLLWKREEKTQEQLAYEALQAQIAEEEARHADSIKALREQAEKLKPKNTP